MDIKKLQEYYNRVNACALLVGKDLDLDDLREKVSKSAFYTEELSVIMGELLVEKTVLEHTLIDKSFEYELKVTKHMGDIEVKNLATIKERNNFINYCLLKDEYKEILDLEQKLKDLKSLLSLPQKRSKDLDRTYPKLKILWESIQSEIKNIKKIGSDAAYINKVKDEINNEYVQKKPIFTDNFVEQIKKEEYKVIKEFDVVVVL